jgi:hypothetical protein
MEHQLNNIEHQLWEPSTQRLERIVKDGSPSGQLLRGAALSIHRILPLRRFAHGLADKSGRAWTTSQQQKSDQERHRLSLQTGKCRQRRSRATSGVVPVISHWV